MAKNGQAMADPGCPPGLEAPGPSIGPESAVARRASLRHIVVCEHVAGQKQLSSASSDTSDHGIPKDESTDDSGWGSSDEGAARHCREGRTALRSMAAVFVPTAAKGAALLAPPGLADELPCPGALSERIEHGAITTMMLKNLPRSCTRDMITHLLDSKGFSTLYDFVYVPTNLQTQRNCGYAFLNMTSTAAAKCLAAAFSGFRDWSTICAPPLPVKSCEVSESKFQGLAINVGRYQNSPLMGESVPDAYKPAVFWCGKQVPFPAPTQRVRGFRPRRGAEGFLTPGCK